MARPHTVRRDPSPSALLGLGIVALLFGLGPRMGAAWQIAAPAVEESPADTDSLEEDPFDAADPGEPMDDGFDDPTGDPPDEGEDLPEAKGRVKPPSSRVRPLPIDTKLNRKLRIPPALPFHMGREIAQTMHYTGAPWLVRESRQREEDCRMMLDALGVPAARRFPWPVEFTPADAASAYEAAWTKRSPTKAFDLCVLGLGDDSHIASLWPKCPLIGQKTGPRFTATEWPGRGWRLTITEAGLAQCAAIVVLVGGAGKAAALREITHGEFAPSAHPGQVLRAHSSRVTWLADQPAAALL